MQLYYFSFLVIKICISKMRKKGILCLREVADASVVMRLLCFSVLCLSGCSSKGMVEENERRALLQLRDSLNYPNGSALIHQWVGDDYCAWQGVSCGVNSSRVVEIALPWEREEELGIWYPNATIISQFKELESLDLSYNQISGWVMGEALCGLKNLKHLVLRGNRLDDESLPFCRFPNLPLLEHLDLSDNNLKGSSSFLSALCGLKNLKYLDLSSNRLDNESLPFCLFPNLPLLEYLDLSDNNLKGSSSFLSALCGLKNLKHLVLRGNRLDDESLPFCLFPNFPLLEHLGLSDNNLKGSSSFLSALCGLKNLKYLDLSSNRLDNESLPFCLFHNLPLLEYLDLSDNNLKGSSSFLSSTYLLNNLKGSSTLCGLKNLKYLYLVDNHLDDESLPFYLFHNLPLLEDLELSWNNLKDSSSLFSGICELRNLLLLDLSQNQLQGGIHPCLGQMNSLRYLDLSHNEINGSFPSFSFSNLTSLGQLFLSDNSFGGILSFSMFANLSKLYSIDLSNNIGLEVETESPTWIPSFQLDLLDLSNCKLNARSGHIFPSFISNQHKLGSVDLSHNFLQGTVPSWLLYNYTDLYTLVLSGNSLSGQLPVSSQIQASTLSLLDISDNRIGQLPDDIDKLFPQLMMLNVSQNALEGSIPPSFGNMSYLEVLDLSHNTLRGQIPQRLTQNNTLLEVLILSSNNFHGEIMPRFSDMTNLVYLQLQNNGFTGNIPAGMVNMPNLVVLDVSGNNLSGNLSNWFSALPNLNALILARNIFHGEIPVSLCQMENLSILDLSANRLSGVLPSCLNNIAAWKKETTIYYPFRILLRRASISYRAKVPFRTKGNSLSFEGVPLSFMTGIDLSSNQLSGEIPSSMGELTMLRSINFSHNVLVGHFPESFQNLENLESLDLSHNRLAGILPPQIVQLHFITTFSVAFNNFSGRIPYEKQFSTFNESSYVGNPGLCGLPLPLKENCPSENPPQQDYGHAKEDKPGIADSDLFFFSCVAVCYVLGFWAVITPLILNRNWRRRYYEVVDSCIDLCSEKLFGFWLRVKIYHRN